MNRPVVLLVLVACAGLAAYFYTRDLRHTPAPSAAVSASAAGAQASAAPAQSAQSAPQAAQTGSLVANASSAATAQAANDTAPDPNAGSLEHIVSMPANEQLPNGRWKAGVNFDPIVPAQPTVVPKGKVEVLEVFWLGCPHCYALEPYIQKWLKTKPSYIDFVRIPVMWGPVHRLHAKLFYTLEALHRDDLVEKAFDTIHQDNNPLIGTSEQDTFVKQRDWAQTQGIDPKAFTTAYNSFAVNADLQHAQEITERYHVEGVPMVVVDGKYSTDVGKAGGHEQLIQLIDALAAFDHHDHSHRA